MTPKHILITGAAGAIGGQLSARFRDHHPQATLTLVDLNAKALEAAARQHRANAEACDLTDIDALPAWWQALTDRHGPVDVLVNCAGIMDILTVHGTGWERGKRLLDINFTAPMRLMDLALPSMVSNRHGCVINVASMAGRVPIRGCSYYGGAKAGIGLASEIARLDLKKDGVNVITVYPGPIYSGLESHARSQVKQGPISRFIPTGRPEILADRIYKAFSKNSARVIYPDIYSVAKQIANLNLTHRAMDFFSPQPNE
ncbi:short chain dehydrogenase [Alcanivorax hongdengensis A-11-3]|uniref:Short chain dehydrogenase n=1 Tax=Alcanivorax hongdengensis A-11-3 TaxID=1177179 RepID=L0WB31_9GAMM|nr:SDR family NAD(P)-dependent oxidoreductase [Alcanivorax hongdengensis]EKF72910.1 short chain dehydrogenase [Alcanivorax hongdengensis A-11-3]